MDEEQTNASDAIGTQEDSTSSTSDNQNVQTDNTASVSNPNAIPNGSPEQQAMAEAGKIAKLQKEINEYKNRIKQQESSWDAIRETYAKAPEAYEAFRAARRRVSGEELPTYETLYSRQPSSQNPQQQQQYSQVGQQNNIDPAQVARAETLKTIEDQRNLEFLYGLGDELNPTSFQDPIDKIRAETTAQAVVGIASTVMQNGEARDVRQALKLAYDRYNQKYAQQQQRAQEAGELKGYADANATGMMGVPSSSTGTGNQVSKPMPSLTDVEKRAYERMLETDKRKGTNAASHFLDQIRKKKG